MLKKRWTTEQQLLKKGNTLSVILECSERREKRVSEQILRQTAKKATALVEREYVICDIGMCTAEGRKGEWANIEKNSEKKLQPSLKGNTLSVILECSERREKRVSEQILRQTAKKSYSLVEREYVICDIGMFRAEGKKGEWANIEKNSEKKLQPSLKGNTLSVILECSERREKRVSEQILRKTAKKSYSHRGKGIRYLWYWNVQSGGKKRWVSKYWEKQRKKATAIAEREYVICDIGMFRAEGKKGEWANIEKNSEKKLQPSWKGNTLSLILECSERREKKLSEQILRKTAKKSYSHRWKGIRYLWYWNVQSGGKKGWVSKYWEKTAKKSYSHRWKGIRYLWYWNVQSGGKKRWVSKYWEKQRKNATAIAEREYVICDIGMFRAEGKKGEWANIETNSEKKLQLSWKGNTLSVILECSERREKKVSEQILRKTAKKSYSHRWKGMRYLWYWNVQSGGKKRWVSKYWEKQRKKSYSHRWKGIRYLWYWNVHSGGKKGWVSKYWEKQRKKRYSHRGKGIRYLWYWNVHSGAKKGWVSKYWDKTAKKSYSSRGKGIRYLWYRNVQSGGKKGWVSKYWEKQWKKSYSHRGKGIRYLWYRNVQSGGKKGWVSKYWEKQRKKATAIVEREYIIFDIGMFRAEGKKGEWANIEKNSEKKSYSFCGKGIRYLWYWNVQSGEKKGWVSKYWEKQRKKSYTHRWKGIRYLWYWNVQSGGNKGWVSKYWEKQRKKATALVEREYVICDIGMCTAEGKKGEWANIEKNSEKKLQPSWKGNTLSLIQECSERREKRVSEQILRKTAKKSYSHRGKGIRYLWYWNVQSGGKKGWVSKYWDKQRKKATAIVEREYVIFDIGMFRAEGKKGEWANIEKNSEKKLQPSWKGNTLSLIQECSEWRGKKGEWANIEKNSEKKLQPSWKGNTLSLIQECSEWREKRVSEQILRKTAKKSYSHRGKGIRYLWYWNVQSGGKKGWVSKYWEKQRKKATAIVEREYVIFDTGMFRVEGKKGWVSKYWEKQRKKATAIVEREYVIFDIGMFRAEGKKGEWANIEKNSEKKLQPFVEREYVIFDIGMFRVEGKKGEWANIEKNSEKKLQPSWKGNTLSLILECSERRGKKGEWANIEKNSEKKLQPSWKGNTLSLILECSERREKRVSEQILRKTAKKSYSHRGKGIRYLWYWNVHSGGKKGWVSKYWEKQRKKATAIVEREYVIFDTGMFRAEGKKGEWANIEKNSEKTLRPSWKGNTLSLILECSERREKRVSELLRKTAKKATAIVEREYVIFDTGMFRAEGKKGEWANIEKNSEKKLQPSWKGNTLSLIQECSEWREKGWVSKYWEKQRKKATAIVEREYVICDIGMFRAEGKKGEWANIEKNSEKKLQL